MATVSRCFRHDARVDLVPGVADDELAVVGVQLAPQVAHGQHHRFDVDRLGIDQGAVEIEQHGGRGVRTSAATLTRGSRARAPSGFSDRTASGRRRRSRSSSRSAVLGRASSSKRHAHADAAVLGHRVHHPHRPGDRRAAPAQPQPEAHAGADLGGLGHDGGEAARAEIQGDRQQRPRAISSSTGSAWATRRLRRMPASGWGPDLLGEQQRLRQLVPGPQVLGSLLGRESSPCLARGEGRRSRSASRSVCRRASAARGSPPRSYSADAAGLPERPTYATPSGFLRFPTMGEMLNSAYRAEPYPGLLAGRAGPWDEAFARSGSVDRRSRGAFPSRPRGAGGQAALRAHPRYVVVDGREHAPAPTRIGDGSPGHEGCDLDDSAAAGRYAYDDSRLYQAKGAIADTIAAFGSAEFALARFAGIDLGQACTITGDCPMDPATGARLHGAQLLRGRLPLQRRPLHLHQLPRRAATPPFNNRILFRSTACRGSGTCAYPDCKAGQVLVPFPGAGGSNYAEMSRWMNGTEATPPFAGANPDPELHADLGTPLASSLDSIREWLTIASSTTGPNSGAAAGRPPLRRRPLQLPAVQRHPAHRRPRVLLRRPAGGGDRLAPDLHQRRHLGRHRRALRDRRQPPRHQQRQRVRDRLRRRRPPSRPASTPSPPPAAPGRPTPPPTGPS